VEGRICVFYLKDKADLWWETVRERQYEPRLNWKRFKELIKDHFYPMSLQKDKENGFIQLQQGGISVLEYASRFMEFSHFASTFVVDKKLKMNHFEVELNPNITERMSVCQYISYQDLYYTAKNAEKGMKEKNDYCNEQGGTRRRGISEKTSTLKAHTRGLGTTISTATHVEGSKLTINLG